MNKAAIRREQGPLADFNEAMRAATSSTSPGIVRFVLSAALDPSDEVSQLVPGVIMYFRSVKDEEE